MSIFKSSSADARAIFDAAIKKVQPDELLADQLVNKGDAITICGKKIKKSEFKNIYVIGAGKASAAMAVATEKLLGNLLTAGVVTTKYGHYLSTHKIQILEAAHPIPDEKSIAAIAKTLELLRHAKPDDLIICLISGGASALWCDLPEGILLPELQTAVQLLINSGASIDEINIVRKQLSNIKGGKLLNYCNGARVFALIISDVIGDDLSTIARGPTVADHSSPADALQLIKNYNLEKLIAPSVLEHLSRLIEKDRVTPKTISPDNVSNHIIGSNNMAIMAAAAMAESLGYHTITLTEPIFGDVAMAAKNFTSMALNYKGKKPACIVQGGETTVEVTGTGKGGRNQHFALVALDELRKQGQTLNALSNVTILSGGTDGTDGPTDATGALVNKETLLLVYDRNLNIDNALKDHNSYEFFKETNSLIITGPTQTNVMDLMLALIH